ncbi:MAG: cytochrome c3 family protein [Phycisphaerae bacterium]|nr:cytochrome c3 family protein [Phycisphaerae bacterium]
MNEMLERSGVRRWVIAGMMVMIGGVSVAVTGSFSFAQEEPKPATATTEPERPPVVAPLGAFTGDCRRCHTCDHPSAENPCLHPCPRPRAAEFAEELKKTHVPDGVILLDMLSDVKDVTDHFGPVPFDHAGHAKWAEIADGCTMCHHYTPEGASHPACRTCHEASFIHEDMRKPGLKGAYHRQCMGCHREWSHDTRCRACHITRVGEGSGADRGQETATADDAIGRMHPPIPAPDVEIYQTSGEARPSTEVIFRHGEHVHRFGLKCAECHRGNSCTRCHEVGKTHVQKKRTLAEHHQDCVACHLADTEEGGNCNRCHWKEGQPKPQPFDHASTGWPLSRYHKDNNCRACHKTARFEKLDRDCNTCHAAWQPDNFDHKVTGQVLDETHAEHDCEGCHIDRKFDRPPVCSECHDVDEGITFPKKRPGPVVETK